MNVEKKNQRLYQYNSMSRLNKILTLLNKIFPKISSFIYLHLFTENGLANYAIQGQKSSLLGLVLLPLAWYNDDGSVATDSLLNGQEILVVNHGNLTTSEASDVQGVICEQDSTTK